MASPKAINQPTLMAELAQRYAVVQKELEEAEAAWMDAQED